MPKKQGYKKEGSRTSTDKIKKATAKKPMKKKK